MILLRISGQNPNAKNTFKTKNLCFETIRIQYYFCESNGLYSIIRRKNGKTNTKKKSYLQITNFMQNQL